MLYPPRFEVGDTRRFTMTYSVAPGSAPVFTVTVGSELVSSATATASGATQFHALFTMPGSAGTVCAYTWTASYTDGPVVDRGLFQIVRTTTW